MVVSGMKIILSGQKDDTLEFRNALTVLQTSQHRSVFNMHILIWCQAVDSNLKIVTNDAT